RVLQTRTWTRVTDDVTCAEHTVEVACWQRRCRMVLYRRHVEHETAKNFQLDLFDPNDGHYEYSAVVTNKPIDGRALWAFMCGRGVHEKVYGELKSGLAFGSVPSMRYAANSAWQCLSVLAFNLSRSFQLATTASRRAASRKRRALFRFETIHTLRALCLHRARLEASGEAIRSSLRVVKSVLPSHLGPPNFAPATSSLGFHSPSAPSVLPSGR